MFLPLFLKRFPLNPFLVLSTLVFDTHTKNPLLFSINNNKQPTQTNRVGNGFQRLRWMTKRWRSATWSGRMYSCCAYFVTIASAVIVGVCGLYSYLRLRMAIPFLTLLNQSSFVQLRKLTTARQDARNGTIGSSCAHIVIEANQDATQLINSAFKTIRKAKSQF